MAYVSVHSSNSFFPGQRLNVLDPLETGNLPVPRTADFFTPFHYAPEHTDRFQRSEWGHFWQPLVYIAQKMF